MIDVCGLGILNYCPAVNILRETMGLPYSLLATMALGIFYRSPPRFVPVVFVVVERPKEPLPLSYTPVVVPPLFASLAIVGLTRPGFPVGEVVVVIEVIVVLPVRIFLRGLMRT